MRAGGAAWARKWCARPPHSPPSTQRPSDCRDLGKPDDWHERQVGRWRSQLDGYHSMPNYDAGGLPHVDEVGRWLSDHLPKDRRIGLIHGDLQFANVLFSLHAPRISGVVDWELATLGDPLLDLGWVLGSWWEKGDPDGKRPLVSPWEDFTARAELARLYGEITRRSPRRVALVLRASPVTSSPACSRVPMPARGRARCRRTSASRFAPMASGRCARPCRSSRADPAGIDAAGLRHSSRLWP